MDDAAKFTDEGWYASGALNHAFTGHWLRPGDFNPMVTIPLWPLLLSVIFHFTGISLDAARALAFLFTLGTVMLAGALVRRAHPRLVLPLFFFSRLAILEAALLFFLTFAALAALRAEPGIAAAPGWLSICGLLLAAATLTKSSAPFGFPAVLYLVWMPRRRDPRRALTALLLVLLVFAGVYGAWWLMVIRTHPADVRVLYHENMPYLGLRSLTKAVRIVYRSFTWIDRLLFPLACVAVLASVTRMRVLWKDPLFGFGVFAYAGYCGFLLAHFDAGPRYFAVLVLPLMLLVLLWEQALKALVPLAAQGVQAIVALALVLNVIYVASHLLHPSYTLRAAELAAKQVIDSNPEANRLVIGHGAMESSFVTGVPALDDLGEMPVAQKLRLQHPGWVLTYSDNTALFSAPQVQDHFRFALAGQYPVMDEPGREHLLLYRIEPKQQR
jgi:4-amino-4-deoxy-L-arabinose transferase-like glycosyltransferase